MCSYHISSTVVQILSSIVGLSIIYRDVFELVESMLRIDEVRVLFVLCRVIIFFFFFPRVNLLKVLLAFVTQASQKPIKIASRASEK